MFAQLGHIRFELTFYFGGIESVHRYDFSQHARMQGKPRLQAMGDALDVVTLEIRLHSRWCSPGEVEAKLREIAGRKEAQALIFGDGTYKGKFVVGEITVTAQHAAPDGTMLWLDLQLQLTEWVDDEPLVTARKKQQAKAPAAKKPSAKAPAKAKKGTPPFTIQTETNKDGFSVNKIVRQG